VLDDRRYNEEGALDMQRYVFKMLGLMSCGVFWQMARNKKIIKRLYISFPESFSVKIAGQFLTKRLSQRNVLVETAHVKQSRNFPSWV
jgi:hypothetical protein